MGGMSGVLYIHFSMYLLLGRYICRYECPMAVQSDTKVRQGMEHIARI